MTATHLPETIRKQWYENVYQHLEYAWKGCHYYREQCERAKASWRAKLNDGTPVTTMHYSYDFAQQVHFPFDSQQRGPAYFKTARKCEIFGVCCEGKGEQVNYLIDEAENPGKWLIVPSVSFIVILRSMGVEKKMFAFMPTTVQARINC